MDAETRIKTTLGDLVVQLAAAHAKIDELTDQLKVFEEHNHAKVNGPMSRVPPREHEKL